MRQELLHFLYAHVAGMALAVKHDKAFDPTQIGCFGAYAIVPGANGGADLVQKFGGLALTLQHRILLVETREYNAWNTEHMNTIPKMNTCRQGRCRDCRAEARLAVSHGGDQGVAPSRQPLSDRRTARARVLAARSARRRQVRPAAAATRWARPSCM